ncbi:hypothetical protein CHLRE_02g100400v5 [Chlamydomonas reinhardtii]|uniref:Uncharacterized protein n=1 Tax=Chlamydomonas reinhardtii TaxID=3055 RepID=A0A2K3E2A5_CHLRE|nr:uncharacterized protein CHLRE_02g100400v5 [Chlamydomonas reinhardtii]PNW86897.1 hypothetical protein CHLRE_02g100400v5 [Chlamydomonas reinhardtii]
MSYFARFTQASSMRHAAAAWRAGATQMHAARVAMAASQRLAGGPVFSAPPPPPPSPAAGFSSSPAMGTSFAASGLLGSSGGASTALEGSDGTGEGNSLGGASHKEAVLAVTKRCRKRRKRF